MPSLFAAVRPELKQINTVYILAMGNGVDQFLANQLTSAGVFQVVTDPKKADAILTDRVGEPFEKKLDELYPPPPPPPPPSRSKRMTTRTRIRTQKRRIPPRSLLWI